MRHGYYIPALGQRFGDEEFSALAKAKWDAMEITTPYPADGISIYDGETGGTYLVIRDWFHPFIIGSKGEKRPKYHVRELSR